MNDEEIEDELWCVEANIVLERAYGPGGLESKNGTRLFRGGAKVFIVGAYYGIGEKVVVIGHHRKSVKLICSVVSVDLLEKFKVNKIYSDKARRMAINKSKNSEGAYVPVTEKSEMEKMATDIANWKRYIQEEKKKKEGE